MKLVVIESPYAGEVERNVAYARGALEHSLSLGEAPLASHLLYTQVLFDELPADRALGIAAGLAWRRVAELAVFYTDLGWSPGMLAAREIYRAEARPMEERSLPVRYRPLWLQSGALAELTEFALRQFYTNNALYRKLKGPDS